MKKILGLDLGTNSIGWALIEFDKKENPDLVGEGKILGLGSRIIPMDQGTLNNFEAGVTDSQTAVRTAYRSARRLRQRHLIRRERLLRVLQHINFLPEHFKKAVDNQGHLIDKNAKIPYYNNEFIFKSSFQEMLSEMNKTGANKDNGIKVPYDWTIYFLRKKALTEKISKEELAWILLNFNQKRGYYQLRGKKDEAKSDQKSEEFMELTVTEVKETGDSGAKGKEYSILYDNGLEQILTTKKSPADQLGLKKQLIVTKKIRKNGEASFSFREPKEGDWTLEKKKTEKQLKTSGKTVGEFIYESLKNEPHQKIRGELIRTIERTYYRDELEQILRAQSGFHKEFQDKQLYKEVIDKLYPKNIGHQAHLIKQGFDYLFIQDIIFYQRPLKTKKSQIAKCRFEKRHFKNREGKLETVGINGIPKSHPLFQEFRIWQWIHNLRILQREKEVNGKLVFNYDITGELLSDNQKFELFKYCTTRKSVTQKQLLKGHFKLELADYKWNYGEEDKAEIKLNETEAALRKGLKDAELPEKLIEDRDFKERLWHLLYSVDDKSTLENALGKFCKQYELGDKFVGVFKKIPQFDKAYAAYSHKALNKLLPLMRTGQAFSESAIPEQVIVKLQKLIDGEFDESIDESVREIIAQRAPESLVDFQGLPLWVATYVVYGKHAEATEIEKWKHPADIEKFLRNFNQHALRNPIVQQVVSECLRVVKDLWNYYGDGKENYFDEIHLELARNLKSSADQRKKINQRRQENQNTNERVRALLRDLASDPQFEGIKANSPFQMEALKIFEEGALVAEDVPDEIYKISKLAEPSKKQIAKYKIWLEQRYRSPYTGDIIPLSKLFTHHYEIEHVIPRKRFYDDSFGNKVICEAEVNALKGNALAMEFIQQHEGREMVLSSGRNTTIFTREAYIEHIKKSFSGAKSKKKKEHLLMEEIPQKMVERQLNDTRFISKKMKQLLSNIVREENEKDLTAKRLIPVVGQVTSELRNAWGLNHVWNELISARFKRMNDITNSNDYGFINAKGVFVPSVPPELKKGFSKKRIDHRHHALDALVVACVTRNHVNYYSNKSHWQSAEEEERKKLRHDLKNKLFIHNQGNGIMPGGKQLKKPWKNFTTEAGSSLARVISSHKQNLRVINKAVNYYEHYEKIDGEWKKCFIEQSKGDHWAIRKPLHKETVYGKVLIEDGKTVPVRKAVELANEGKSELIADPKIRSEIIDLLKQQGSVKAAQDSLKKQPLEKKGSKLSRVKLYTEGTASRSSLDEGTNVKRITDKGIRKIVEQHLAQAKYQNRTDANGKALDPKSLALSPEGLRDMNQNLRALNGGKDHQPIKKVRIWEPGNRFQLGEDGAKAKKFVESAKGTNLFFAIYEDEHGKRNYESIPLNELIEHQKQMAALPKDQRTKVPVNSELGELLMVLSPGDLVFVPSPTLKHDGQIDPERIYKMVRSTEEECYFLQHNIASLIKQYDSKTRIGEFKSQNISEKSLDEVVIKQFGMKLQVNRIGELI